MRFAAALLAIATWSPTPSTQVVRNVGLAEYVRVSQAAITRQLLAAAERMPEGDYDFRPGETSNTRTYRAVIAHAADGMFGACAAVKDEPNPTPHVEQRLTSKADTVRALTDAVAYCDGLFAGLTQANAEDAVRQGPVDITRAAALMGVLAHNAEMFGISTVYLRARNIVPPGSK